MEALSFFKSLPKPEAIAITVVNFPMDTQT